MKLRLYLLFVYYRGRNCLYFLLPWYMSRQPRTNQVTLLSFILPSSGRQSVFRLFAIRSCSVLPFRSLNFIVIIQIRQITTFGPSAYLPKSKIKIRSQYRSLNDIYYLHTLWLTKIRRTPMATETKRTGMCQKSNSSLRWVLREKFTNAKCHISV